MFGSPARLATRVHRRGECCDARPDLHKVARPLKVAARCSLASEFLARVQERGNGRREETRVQGCGAAYHRRTKWRAILCSRCSRCSRYASKPLSAPRDINGMRLSTAGASRCSSLGHRWGAGGRWFKSRSPDHLKNRNSRHRS